MSGNTNIFKLFEDVEKELALAKENAEQMKNLEEKNSFIIDMFEKNLKFIKDQIKTINDFNQESKVIIDELTTLKEPFKDGESAYEIALRLGLTVLDEDAWIKSLKGENGLNIYELFIEKELFEGTIEEFLEFMKGEKGDIGEDGKSSYEVAVEQGFEGTVKEWINSLKGRKGDKGEDAVIDYIALDNAINEQLGKKFGIFEEEPEDKTGYSDEFLFFIKEK